MKLKRRDVERLGELIVMLAVTKNPADGLSSLLKACQMLRIDALTLSKLLDGFPRSSDHGYTTRVEALEVECPTCHSPAATQCRQTLMVGPEGAKALVQPRRASHSARHALALAKGATPQPLNSKAVIIDESVPRG